MKSTRFNRLRAINFFLLAAFLILISGNPATAQTRAWGYNFHGNLGIGNTTDPQPNPQTAATLPDATGIGAGFWHTVFLKADGTIVTAGRNDTGQLGTGGTGASEPTPVSVSGLNDIVQVTAGERNSAALRLDGTVWVWGFNTIGQIGNGTTTGTGCLCIPTPTQSSISNVVRIDAGQAFILALKSDGTVWGWGSNSTYGPLGDGTTTNRSSPVQVGVGVAGFNNIIAISAGDFHSMALKADGTVWVWGRNIEGQIGNGATSFPVTSPTMNTTLTGVTQIAAGSTHNVARKTDGTVWIWGYGAFGQVGNGTWGDNLFITTPTQNPNVSDIIDISAGGFHNLAKKRDGSVWAWGQNSSGQVGNGSVDPAGCKCRTTPVQSSVGTGNALIMTGRQHSFSANPTITTPTGSNVQHFGENVSFGFANVTNSGTTGYTAIDPTATGLNVPAGYVIQPNAPAYNITTTATTSGNIDVCLEVQSEYNQAQFPLLKILHGEGLNLVDRTVSFDYIRRRLCARVTTLSPFVIAQGLAPTASNVSIGGRVTSAKGHGITKVRVTLIEADGSIRTALTSAFGYYRFDEIEAGQTVVVSIFSKRFQFNQPTQIVAVTENLEELNFTAQP